MSLYFNTNSITPSKGGSGGGSVSGTIIATNKSFFPITRGSKVWVEPTTIDNVTTYTIKDFNKILQKNTTIAEDRLVVYPDNSVGGFYMGGYDVNGYLTVNAPASASRFECIIAFNIKMRDGGPFQNILCFDPFLELYIENYQLCVWSSTASDFVTCGNVSANTKYYAKVIIENGVTTLSYSRDGTTFTGTVSISNTETSITSNKIGAGLYNSRYFRGYLYLDESYIKFDNTLFELPYKTDAFTGIAQENIAINSNGEVLIVMEN